MPQHWNDKSGDNFYHCIGDSCGFLVEVSTHDGRGQTVLLRSLSDLEALSDTQEIRLLGAKKPLIWVYYMGAQNKKRPLR
jgi:hypothetical protein